MRLPIATCMRWRRSLKRMVRRHWRHTAPMALALMCVSGLVMVWNSRVGKLGVAASEIWIMTVPCGIVVINKNKVLWVLRQIYFGALAASMIMSALR